MTLAGKVAIVTGASGGLGTTLCERFREEGAEVVPVDLAGEGVVRADIATDEGNALMVRTALERHGRLDVLVLNAGAQFMAPIAEFPEDQWDRLMDVMVKGPFLAMKHAWAALTERVGGRIVVVSSGSAFIAESFKSAYVAAKHGVVGLVKVAALEGGDRGLTANAIAPGWMRTPLVEKQLESQMRLHDLTREEVIEHMVARHPVKRFVETREVANLAVFLASDAASGITGATIPVDLGLLVA